MRDPATENSRVYVGNLLENITSPDLTTHFSKYGVIRGVLINRGFGFIQFENDASAKSAIQNENNTIFQGRKIIVRNAVKNPTPAAAGGPQVGGLTTQKLPLQPTEAIGQDLNRTARPQPWNNRKNNRPGPSNINNDRDRSPLGGGGGGGNIDQGKL